MRYLLNWVKAPNKSEVVIRNTSRSNYTQSICKNFCNNFGNKITEYVRTILNNRDSIQNLGDENNKVRRQIADIV